MKILFRVAWLIIILIGAAYAKVCPTEYLYIMGFIVGNISLALLNLSSDNE